MIYFERDVNEKRWKTRNQTFQFCTHNSSNKFSCFRMTFRYFFLIIHIYPVSFFFKKKNIGPTLHYLWIVLYINKTKYSLKHNSNFVFSLFRIVSVCLNLVFAIDVFFCFQIQMAFCPMIHKWYDPKKKLWAEFTDDILFIIRISSPTWIIKMSFLARHIGRQLIKHCFCSDVVLFVSFGVFFYLSLLCFRVKSKYDK